MRVELRISISKFVDDIVIDLCHSPYQFLFVSPKLKITNLNKSVVIFYSVVDLLEPASMAAAVSAAAAASASTNHTIAPENDVTLETISDQLKNRRQLSPIIIAIEGNIGSGKTTLLEALREYMKSVPQLDENKNPRKIIFYEEPLDEWSEIRDSAGETLLSKFYADQPKYAFTFQIMALMSRLKKFQQLIKEKRDGTIIVCERSMLTHRHIFFQMLADSGVIDEVSFKVYKKWFDDMLDKIPVHGYVYVKATPEVCHSRVGIRAREGETISKEYLEMCHKYHEDWLGGVPSKNILVLDGCKEFSQNSERMIAEYMCWITQVRDFINAKAAEMGELRINAMKETLISEIIPRLKKLLGNRELSEASNLFINILRDFLGRPSNFAETWNAFISSRDYWNTTTKTKTFDIHNLKGLDQLGDLTDLFFNCEKSMLGDKYTPKLDIQLDSLSVLLKISTILRYNILPILWG